MYHSMPASEIQNCFPKHVTNIGKRDIVSAFYETKLKRHLSAHVRRWTAGSSFLAPSSRRRRSPGTSSRRWSTTTTSTASAPSIASFALNISNTSFLISLKLFPITLSFTTSHALVHRRRNYAWTCANISDSQPAM